MIVLTENQENGKSPLTGLLYPVVKKTRVLEVDSFLPSA